MTREKRTLRRWTKEEDRKLLNQIRVFPQNLHKCFLIVSEETGRSEKAVAAHWYTQLSKQKEAMCFFTASPRHVSRNRKNGMGVATSNTIWRRLLAVLRGIM